MARPVDALIRAALEVSNGCIWSQMSTANNGHDRTQVQMGRLVAAAQQ